LSKVRWGLEGVRSSLERTIRVGDMQLSHRFAIPQDFQKPAILIVWEA